MKISAFATSCSASPATGLWTAAVALGLCLLPHVSLPATHDPGPLPGPWSTFAKDYGGQRYSSLASINTHNVASLKRVCEVQLGDSGAFQSGLVVIGSTMYVTTAHTIVAMDAANCKIRWQYVYTPEESEVSQVNRGVAYYDGRVFRGTADGRVLAIDANTGKQLWRIKAANPGVGEFFSSAPIAWKNRVFIGTAGGDWGIRGRMLAFDADTGQRRWQFNLIPERGEPGFETWKIPDSANHGGGATWSTYTLDPDTGELFVPVGNPAPAFSPDTRPGDNLYTNSVVVLDAKTGKLKWYHQFLPNDGLDYDVAAAPVLYRDPKGRRMMAIGSKDGYLYGIDRDTHHLVFRTPVTTVMDPPPRPTASGVRACPGFAGGVQWNGPAINPETNVLYVGSVDLCSVVKTGAEEYVPGKLYHGTVAQLSTDDRDITARGWLVAVDSTTGKVLWKYHSDSPVLAGVTPTAGGLVFTGNVGGEFMAFDAKTGRQCYERRMDGALAGGLITYQEGTTQYIAFASGNVSRGPFFAIGGTPTVTIMRTGLIDDRPNIVRVEQDVSAPPQRAMLSNQYRTYFGQNYYLHFCATCHGGNGDGGIGPRLRGITKRSDPRPIAEIIKNPKSAIMPKLYPKPLDDEDVEQIANFLDSWK